MKNGINRIIVVIITFVLCLQTPTVIYAEELSSENTELYEVESVSDNSKAENILEESDIQVMTINSNMVYSAENITLPDNGNYLAIDNDAMNNLKTMHQGTILVDFVPTVTSGVQSLVGISNGTEGYPNSYFTLYFANGKIGFEIRDTSNGDYEKASVNVSLTAGEHYRVGFVANPDYGYQIYLNGELILDKAIRNLSTSRGYGFIDNITGINEGYIGKTRRVSSSGAPTAFEYPYTGTINDVEIYNTVFSSEELIQGTIVPDLHLVYETGQHTITGSSSAVAMTADEVTEVTSLDKGTIVIEFTPDNTTGVQTLLGISNSKNGNANSYFSLYYAKGLIGFEIRRQSEGDFQTSKAPAEVTAGETHTIAMTADPDDGYKLYFDGVLEYKLPSSWFSTQGYGFFSDIPGADTGYIGKTARAGTANNYQYSGNIGYVKIYDYTMSEAELIQRTNTYASDGIVTKTRLYDFGDYNAPGMRIPSIITTQDKVLLSTCDIRYGNSNDPPNNCDIGIRRSYDNGMTWTEPELLLNFTDYPNEPQAQNYQSASYLDSVLLQDQETERVFLFFDVMSGGFAASNSVTSSGYTSVNGEDRLILNDVAGNTYTVGSDNIVYDSNNLATIYSIGSHFALFENGEEISNIFYLASPLQVQKTIFTALMYSDNNGETWSEPRLMNASLKASTMKHCGTAPGRGIQIENGEFAGRLVIPFYYNTSSTTSIFDSCVVYSDDHGATWQMGESANYNRSGGRQQMSENQIVEMPDGQLKMFIRRPGHIDIATSFDGGSSWYDVVETTSLLLSSTTGCQHSVINYSSTINGYPAVILSSPNATTRSNGTIQVGLIKENGTYTSDETDSNYDSLAAGKNTYTFDWISQKVIRDGEFGYSCLTELPNGNIACLYEEQSAVNSVDHTKYGEFTLEYILGDALIAE